MTAYCSETCRVRDRRFHLHDCMPDDVIKQYRADAIPEVTFVSDDSSEESGLELISSHALERAISNEEA